MYEPTKQGIEVALKRIGYIRCNKGNETISILLKTDLNDSKLVLIVEAYRQKAFNKKDYLDKLALSNDFVHIDENHVCVILIGKPEFACRNKNRVIVDVYTGKYRMSMSKVFREDMHIIMRYLDEINRKNKLSRIYVMDQKCNYNTFGIWISILFIALCFLKTWYFYGDTYGISADAVINQGQSYRLLSYMFVHAGIRHVVGNLVALYTIGRAYASRNGIFETMAIFIIGGILAGLCVVNAALKTGDIYTYTVGCSGAIFAVLGAMAYDIVTDRMMKGRKMHIVTYALITLLLSSIGWNVSISCHVGGMVAGIFLKFMIDTVKNVYKNEKIVFWLKTKEVRTDESVL